MTNPPSRPGQIQSLWLAFLGSIGVFFALIGLLRWDPFQPSAPRATEPLHVHCAAGLKRAVEASARDYEKAYDIPVRLQFGGSETILSGIAVSKTGDLFIPADESYLVTARERQLVAEVLPLARMTPVLAVRK